MLQGVVWIIKQIRHFTTNGWHLLYYTVVCQNNCTHNEWSNTMHWSATQHETFKQSLLTCSCTAIHSCQFQTLLYAALYSITRAEPNL